MFCRVVVAACLSTVSIGGAVADDGSPRVGVVLPLTGEFSYFGEQAKEGMLLTAQV